MLLAGSACLHATALAELNVATTCQAARNGEFCNFHGELTGMRRQALPASLADISILAAPAQTGLFDEEAILATPAMISSVQLSFDPRVDGNVARISVNDSVFDAPSHPRLAARTGFINSSVLIDDRPLDLSLAAALRPDDGEKITSTNPADYISSVFRSLAVLVIR